MADTPPVSGKHPANLPDDRDRLIVPNRRILDAWRLSAVDAGPIRPGAFNWPLVVLSLITALEKRDQATGPQCYCPDCGTLHVIKKADPNLSAHKPEGVGP